MDHRWLFGIYCLFYLQVRQKLALYSEPPIKNLKYTDQEVTTDIVKMSSRDGKNLDPYNAIDGDDKSYISSIASTDDDFEPFPTLNITSK